MNHAHTFFWICSIVATAAVAHQASKPAVPDVVRARAFELVDGDGHVIGELRAGSDGAAIFALRNANRDIALQASASNPGGSIRLYGPEQPQSQVELVTGLLGGSMLTRSRSGANSVYLAPSARDLGGEMTVYGAAGVNAATISRDEAGNGAFVAWKPGGAAAHWSSHP